MSAMLDTRITLISTMEASCPKIVLLVMSCNDPVLKTCTEMLDITLGKEAEKYGVKYLTYTGGHSEQSIVNGCIHCVSGDDLDSTFFKTQEALRLVKESFDPDYVIRTNTSTYVNLDLVTKFIKSEMNKHQQRLIYDGEISDLNGRIQLRGNSFILSREIVDKIINFNIDDCTSELENLHDDVVISYIVEKEIGEGKPVIEIAISDKIGIVPMIYLNDLSRIGHPASVIDSRLVKTSRRNRIWLRSEDEIVASVRSSIFISYRKNYTPDRYQEIGECVKIRDMLKGFVAENIPECLKEIYVWNYRERTFYKIQI